MKGTEIMTENDVVLYQLSEGIGLITLNRPQALNALNREMLERLLAVLDEAAEDSSVEALVLTGAGQRAFSAGADIRLMSQASALEVRRLAQLGVRVTRNIEVFEKPVIAAINGAALGGGLEIGESCHLRIASRTAVLGHPEVRIGAIAGWGGTTRLARLIGRGRAAELLLTGATVTADEARELGLVNRVVDADALLPEAEKLVREITVNAPLAVALTWEALHRGGNLTLEESAQLGADLFGLVASTEDFREGTTAFVEKRPPTYRGR
jgi:enoyl-CoA hydratase